MVIDRGRGRMIPAAVAGSLLYAISVGAPFLFRWPSLKLVTYLQLQVILLFLGFFVAYRHGRHTCMFLMIFFASMTISLFDLLTGGFWAQVGAAPLAAWVFWAVAVVSGLCWGYVRRLKDMVESG